MSLVDVANGIEMHGVVKSVQRGIVNVSNINKKLTLPIEIKPEKCLVNIHGSSYYTAPSGKVYPSVGLYTGTLDSNSITIASYKTYDNDVSGSYEIVEFY